MKSLCKLLCYIMIFISCLMLIPAAIANHYHEDLAYQAFMVTFLIVTLSSCCILYLCRSEVGITITPKSSYLFVTLTWIIAAAFGAFPLYLTKTLPTYAKCYFEIMSGFTTTGATALEGIEDKCLSILFWRSMTNWLGGMGIVVLFVAILPFLGVKGTSLVSAESVGPTKDKLTPKTQNTALILWAIYVGLSALETLLLRIGGLSLYDAVTVSFSTMGAAGFSTKNASIGYFNSAYVDTVVTIFMFCAGMNFALFYKIIKGQAKEVLKDGEFRCYLRIIAVISLLCAVNLFHKGYYSTPLKAFRFALFHVVSLITTTGFSSTDINEWPELARALTMILFFVGGCAGSAGGGIKVVRVSAMMVLAKNTIVKRLHPSAVKPAMLGSVALSNDTIMGISGFIGCYFLTGFVGMVLFSASGVDFETAFTASFQFLGNIGFGFSKAGPMENFAFLSPPLLALSSFLMLAGRLELFTVYALFTRSFWKL